MLIGVELSVEALLRHFTGYQAGGFRKDSRLTEALRGLAIAIK